MKIPDTVLNFLQQKSIDKQYSSHLEQSYVAQLFDMVTAGKETVEDPILSEWLTSVIAAGSTDQLIHELCEFHVINETWSIIKI